jgi:hypothetical protein
MEHRGTFKAGAIFLTSRKEDFALEKLLRGRAPGFSDRRFFAHGSRNRRVFLQFPRVFADLARFRRS